jgi:hypothetical protein
VLAAAIAGSGAAEGNDCVMAAPESAAGDSRSGGAAGSRAEAGAAMLKIMTKSIVVRKTRDIFSS